MIPTAMRPDGRKGRLQVSCAGMTLLVASVALAGCMNGSSGPADPWSGHAADDRILNTGWKADGRQAELLQVLGPSDGDDWPGAISMAPLLVDIDQDGKVEVVAHGKDRHVHVFSQDGRVLSRLAVPYPPSWNIDMVLNEVSAGVLVPGEPVSLVVTTPAAHVIAWRFDPDASRNDSFVFEKAWQVRTDTCHRSPGMDAKATLADLDGQPGLEVLVQTEQVGFYALDNQGKVLWHQCWGGGNAAPVAADLDGDGRMEAIFASDSGFVSVVHGRTGEPIWTFDASAPPYNIKPASIVVQPTVAELDGKAPKEILFTARYAPIDDKEMFDDFHMAIFAIHQSPSTWQAEVVWMRQPSWANPLSYTPLLVDDVEGDGVADVFGMDWNTIGHQPGNWDVFPTANAFRLDGRDGSDVWVRPLETYWSNKVLALGDVDKDGQKELLANAPKGGEDGIWRLDVATGAPEGFLTADPWTVTTGPVLAAEGNGHVLAFAARPPDDERIAGVLVYRV